MWKTDYCGNTIKLKSIINSNVENRSLWNHNKIQKNDEIPDMENRQIFNVVEYSETQREFLFWKEKFECQIIIYVGKRKSLYDVIT